MNIALRHNQQKEFERRKLLAVFEAENKSMALLAEQYHAIEQRDEQLTANYCKKVVAAIDRILAAGDWDSSLFLRSVIKPVKRLQEEAKAVIGNAETNVANPAAAGVVASDHKVIYVSLYQAQGQSIAQWRMQLRTIDKHMVGRSIYLSEAGIKKMIRTKVNSQNDAYAILQVKEEAFQESAFIGQQRVDRNGENLVVLKPGAVSMDNVIGFVHEKKYYSFVNGCLKKRF